LPDMRAPIVKLAADAELRRTLGAGGRAFAEERFSVRKNRERYAALFMELLGRG